MTPVRSGAPTASAAPFAVTAACQGCGACLLTCPVHAIRPAPPAAPAPLVVLPSCTACGECVEVCPVDAIAGLPTPSAPIGPGSPGGVAENSFSINYLIENEFLPGVGEIVT